MEYKETFTMAGDGGFEHIKSVKSSTFDTVENILHCISMCNTKTLKDIEVTVSMKCLE